MEVALLYMGNQHVLARNRKRSLVFRSESPFSDRATVNDFVKAEPSLASRVLDDVLEPDFERGSTFFSKPGRIAAGIVGALFYFGEADVQAQKWDPITHQESSIRHAFSKWESAYKLDNIETALFEVRKAGKINPIRVSNYFSKEFGVSYSDLRNFRSDALVDFWNILYSSGNFKSAEWLLNKARIVHDSVSVKTWFSNRLLTTGTDKTLAAKLSYGLGETERLNGNPQEALSYYSAAMSQDKSIYDSAFQSAQIYHQLAKNSSDDDQAYQYANKSTSLYHRCIIHRDKLTNKEFGKIAQKKLGPVLQLTVDLDRARKKNP